MRNSPRSRRRKLKEKRKRLKQLYHKRKERKFKIGKMLRHSRLKVMNFIRLKN